jgi:type IV secretion system protein TrbL
VVVTSARIPPHCGWARLVTGVLAAVITAGLLAVWPTPLRAAAATPPVPPATVSAGLAGGLAMGCLGPDELCDVAGGIKDGVGDVVGGVQDGLGALGGLAGEIPGIGDIPNPLGELASIIAKAAADAWTAAMMAIWDSGLYILRIVLTFSELFLTPDLSADGPGHDVYAFTLWLALALVTILALLQLGAAAFKRDGKSLARAFVGAGQFVVVCACWLGYCVMIVAACGAITRGLMKSLLGVNTWPEWEPLEGLAVQDIADATVATVLAFLGVFLWLAAIGHILVYLARAASLLVLTATGPLAAAGLVSDATRSWFWKSLRWFHAAAFTPVLMVMVLGIGVQMAGGVAAHLSDDTQKAIGTAFPAVMLILISVVAPLALFKLLAFVDPGTPSGASFRQGMAVHGGIQGLLSGGGSDGGSAASTADASGHSAGEQSAEASTGDRFTKSTQGFLAGLGPAGQALAAGIGQVTSAGANATSMLADETNQAGVGQNTFGPDFSGLRPRNSSQGGDSPQQSDPDGQADTESDDGGGSLPPMPPPPPFPPPPTPGRAGSEPGSPSPPSGGQPDGHGGSGEAAKPPAGGAGAAGAGGAGGAGAAGAVPPVA